MSVGLFPEVRDTSTITGVFNQPTFMVIGIEGQADNVGDAVVGTAYTCKTPDEADLHFGPASKLGLLVKFVLGRGAEFVLAVASAKGVAPTLVQRQAAWTVFEENPNVRIRLTGSTTQADLVALADSCEWAEGIQNKQFGVGGLALPTTSANMIAAAAAIASKRFVLVGPGIYDPNGVLLDGSYAAAAWAVERAKNLDLSDDMDLVEIPGMTGIEKSIAGLPLFRLHAGAGTPVNDFETLLAAGVSPLMQSATGGAAMTHARTTYTTDTTFDSINTLLVKDQLFLDIRDTVLAQGVLRRPNIPFWQGLVASHVSDYLSGRSRGPDAWITPKLLPDGTTGFGVNMTESVDRKTMTIHYQAEIDRGTQKVDVNGVLTIAA
jgi:hypothetical protein